MKALIFVFLLSRGAYANCPEIAAPFPRCHVLVEGKAWLSWKTDTLNGAIQMALTRKGEGWMAIGIGEEQSAAMPGADVLLVHKDGGQVVAEDRFAKGLWEPARDAQQDVMLLSHSLESGLSHTILQRPLQSCDMHDRAIRENYPHRIIWAMGADGDWNFKYHGATHGDRGGTTIDFSKSLPAFVFHEEPGVQNVTLRFNQYHIPTAQRPLGHGRWQEGTNQYKCLAAPLENLTNLTAPFDIIGGDPIIASPFLHHFVNSHCRLDPRPNPDIPYGADPENDVFDCAMGALASADCGSLPGWAAGGVAFALGGDIGYHVPEGTRWLVFDTHYYNPDLNENAFDSSGFTYVATKDLKPHKVGSFWLGIDHSMRLAAGMEDVHYGHHCPAESVAHLFPSGRDSVSVLSVTHHLHQRAHSAKTYVVRDGKRIPLLVQEYYDYNYQSSNPVNFTLKRGDALEVDCGYNTKGDVDDIRWGERTQDEMCISILTVYPRADVSDRLNCLFNQVKSPLGDKNFSVLDWNGVEKRVEEVSGQSIHLGMNHPLTASQGACMKPPSSCLAAWWNNGPGPNGSLGCVTSAPCYQEEFCTDTQCFSEAPWKGCELAYQYCPGCYRPDTAELYEQQGECIDCISSCDIFTKHPELSGLVVDMATLPNPLPINGTYDLPFDDDYSSSCERSDHQEKELKEEQMSSAPSKAAFRILAIVLTKLLCFNA